MLALLLAAGASLATSAFAGPPPPAVPVALRARLSEPGTAIARQGATVAVFWRTRYEDGAAPPDAPSDPRVRYGWLRAGHAVGAAWVEQALADARGQDIPPGVYALYYAVQPLLKDHVDTTEARDFLVLVPADRASGAPLALPELIEASRAGTPLHHPRVLELVPAERAGQTDVLTLAGGRPLVLAPPGPGASGQK